MSEKPTNPKDALASTTKLPLHLFPITAIALGCISLLFGALKYGRNNWRKDGARATIYAGATMRHMGDWLEGYDKDADGVDNLGAALASIAIIVDARAAGKLVDDRNYPGGYRDMLPELESQVARLQTITAGKNPEHFTIQSEVLK